MTQQDPGFKVVSFNINSIRARPHQVQAVAANHNPDVIGLQETKVTDGDFPTATATDLGYTPYYHGQKAHYGVALLAKQEPQSLEKGFPGDDDAAQRRFIYGTWNLPDGQPVHILNGYFPQGESRDNEVKFPAKRKFYADLMELLNTSFSPSDNLLVIGDMNIAPVDGDIGIGADNAKRWLRTGKCSFLPEEREWMQTLLDWGLTDSFRHKYPDTDDRFSWFDYRSKGFEREPRRGLRIDLILATQSMMDRLTDCGIDYDVRSQTKPSDHCPIWAAFR